MAKTTGNTLAITFGTTSWTPDISAFNKSGEGTDDIKTSDLATSGYHTYIGGPLIEGGTYSFPFHVDPTITTRPTIGVSETITITYPISVSGNTAGTDSFTGYINSYDTETEPNVLYTGTFVLKVAGDITVVDEA